MSKVAGQGAVPPGGGMMACLSCGRAWLRWASSGAANHTCPATPRWRVASWWRCSRLGRLELDAALILSAKPAVSSLKLRVFYRLGY